MTYNRRDESAAQADSFYNLEKLPGKVKVVIPKKVQQEIKFLCREIPNIEWSGVLFYDIVEGSVEDVENLKIELKGIMPKDMGTSATTNYFFGLDVTNFIVENEFDKKGYMIAHIHSHHNMSVFFSGTDSMELKNNAKNHRFYLSIVVNNKGDIIGRLVFNSVLEKPENFKLVYKANNEMGLPFDFKEVEKLNIPEEINFYYDCEIIEEKEEDKLTEDFKDLVSKIKKDVSFYSNSTYSKSYNPFNDSENNKKEFHKESDKTFKTNISKKKVSEPTIIDVLPKLLFCGYNVNYAELGKASSNLASAVNYLESSEDFDLETSLDYIETDLGVFLTECFYDYNSFKIYTLDTILRILERNIIDPKVIEKVKEVSSKLIDAVKKFYKQELPHLYKNKYEN